MIAKRGFMKDPRLRSKYREFLESRGSAPYNPPGLDRNRGAQAVNAVQGRGTYQTTERPRYGGGDRLQQFLRNRSTEQAGLPRPAAPASVQYARPRRAY
jgi:hypothetical protein